MIRSHVYLHTKARRRDEVVNALNRLEVITAAREQPGFLAAEVQVPYDDPNQLLVWSSWASREHYERWLASPACEAMFREIAKLVAEEPELRVYHVVDAVQ
ncbi:MAG TPA: antibiotic biosynthesis monooxygenase [Gaiellaceae bacterium]|jgi:quinol monooxygenase YgiN|nr:antibiotic biosynthesis monooxygenase [Gaiellaceae bacterium]